MEKIDSKMVAQGMCELHNWYKTHQDGLVALYDGKFLLIGKNDFVVAFDTLDEAYIHGRDSVGMGNFIVQKCSPGPRDYTLYSNPRLHL